MERFWEVDFTRGIALIMMLFSNFITDLQVFANYTKFAGFWKYFAIITAFIFIFIAGLSLNISYSNAKKENKANFAKYAKRGLFIFCLGFVITAATYLALGDYYIRFGVLHLIGLSVIFAYPFLKWKRRIALVVGCSIILLGLAIQYLTFNTNLLLFLGMHTASFASIDYFPLLPWFGVILVGLYAGKLFYKHGEKNFKQNFQLKASNPVCVLGRNTLFIYMIHQPIFIGILYLLGIKIFGA